MLAQHYVGLWKPLEQPVIYHRLRTLRHLFTGLENRHYCSMPGFCGLSLAARWRLPTRPHACHGRRHAPRARIALTSVAVTVLA